MDNLSVPPGTTPNDTHVASFHRQRDNKLQNSRVKYLRKYYPNASLQERRNIMDQLKESNYDYYEQADVLYDSWSAVTGKCRSIFPVEKLFQRYPSLKNKVKKLRQLMGIRVLSVDVEEIAAAEVRQTLRKIVDNVVVMEEEV